MSNNRLEYVFSLTDLVSAKLQNINVASEKTLNVFAGLQMQGQTVNRAFAETGRTLSSLRDKVKFLQNEKEFIPANNIKGVKAYNYEINKLNKEINKLENVKGGGFKGWVNSLTDSIPALRMVLNPIVLIGAAALKLTSTINSGLRAWGLQTEAETKLAAVMKNTMDATEAEIKSVLKLTAAQQKLGVVGDEIQLAGAQELATYLTRRDSMQTILPLMNDMLAQQYGLNATQEQAVNIASMLGKVMDGQTGALSRYGYKFTEAQEKVLKYGKETERAAVLAEVIGEAVGGVNAALAQTPAGKWKQAENDAGDLMERVGKLAETFRNALFPVFDLSGKIFNKVVTFFESRSGAITAVIEKIANGIVKSVTAVYSIIKKVGGVLSDFFGAIRDGNPFVIGLTSVIGALSVAFAINYALQQKAVLTAKAAVLWNTIQTTVTGGLTGATAALNAVFLASPLGWIALAVGAVVAAVVVCWNKFEGFRKVVLGVWETMKDFGKNLLNAVLEPIKKIISGLGTMGKAIAELFKGNFKEAWNTAKTGAKELASGVFNANPAVAVYNAAKKTDFKNAYDKGAQKGAESWQKSQEKKKAKKENPAAPELGELPDLTFKDDPKGIKTESGKSKKTINLNDLTTVQNFNTSAAYTEATRKLSPVSVNLTAAAPKIPAPALTLNPKIEAPKIAVNNPIDEKKQNYEEPPKNTQLIADILQNVRRIAAATALPIAVAFSPADVQATATPQNMPATENTNFFFPEQNRNANGQTVQIDRVCDSIVINVANTDGRGKEEIKNAIFDVLNEIAEV